MWQLLTLKFLANNFLWRLISFNTVIKGIVTPKMPYFGTFCMKSFISENSLYRIFSKFVVKALIICNLIARLPIQFWEKFVGKCKKCLKLAPKRQFPPLWLNHTIHRQFSKTGGGDPLFFLCKWTTCDQSLLWQILKKFYRQSFTA